MTATRQTTTRIDALTSADPEAAHRPDDRELAIDVQELRHAYGSTVAVEGLDLRVRRGELYALLGTNGAGKTTTLEVLEGHRRPTGGRVRVLGGDPGDRAAIRPRIGMMLQDSGLAPELSSREMLALAGAISGRLDDPDRLLRRVRLEHRAATRVAQLSGGERRRLDFACAVWGSPELLFLDEPTTGLDPEARDDLWRLVASLRADGATILLTTHYLEEAEANADRIGIMHAGALRHEGTLAELSDGASEIRFAPPVGLDELPVAVARVENGLAIVLTHEPQRTAATLLSWADERGLELARFSTRERGLGELFRETAR